MISFGTRLKLGEQVSKADLDAENRRQSKVTGIDGQEFSDVEKGLLRTNALTLDDNPWSQLKLGTGSPAAQALAPTYEPMQLHLLVQQNNTLQQCVAAMEVNIDGTGYDFEEIEVKAKPKIKQAPDPEAPKDDEKLEGEEVPVKEDDPEYQNLKAFFGEPWPMVSFTAIRRKIRRDLESAGVAYMEVVRDAEGKLAGLNHLDAKLTRMVKLDNTPVVVEKEFMRGDKVVKIQMEVRERRFVQVIGTQVRYFQEYKASRSVNVKTGEWVAPGDVAKDGDKELPKSTEVIMFTLIPDVTTPYGVPRWINNMPSVLGSRRAEEYNLEFFNNGGVPPVMIMIQGGQLTKDSRTALTQYLAGKAKYKQRAVIAEIFSTSGDLSGANNVKVNVERFGSEKQQDSMFEKYDERSHVRVRMAFRLPPLFLGLAQDYNFATAKSAIMITEEQVFKPEREAFDEIINNTIVRELSSKYKIRSLPITVKDVETMLKGLEMGKDLTSPEDYLDEVNEITGLNLPLDQEALDMKKEREQEEHENNMLVQTATAQAKAAGKTPFPVEKVDLTVESDSILNELAQDWADLMGGSKRFEPASVKAMKTIIKGMAPPVRKLFNSVVATRLAAPSADPAGTEELIGCAGECLHGD